MKLTEKQQKALDNIKKLKGVYYTYLEWLMLQDNKLSFYEWLGSDIQKKLTFYYEERKFFDKMHRIVFENSYAKDYKF